MILRLLTIILLSVASASTAERPNIILMMVDDLGFSDFGCYGSEIETPHIDSLAADGLRFRNFYNTAKCHSSRVSLLTGLYCDQAGAESLKFGVTIPQVMQKAGYRTAMVGKWHLNDQPTDHGFERYFGHLSGATNFFVGDDTFRLNGEVWNDFDEDFYTTDAWIEYAQRFVTELKEESPDDPFFLYIAHNAPHYPLQAPEEDFRKYEDRYNGGWDEVRARRNKKQVEVGVIDADWEIAPRPTLVPAWETLDDEQRDWESRRMAAFAAMVDRVDQTTGTLIEYLKANDLFENTLIMICSDNGACPFERTEGKEFDPWDSRSYWLYDTGWSHVGNTPHRLHKQNQHQGGISSPMIAHWPAGLTAEKGSVTEQRGHLIDFMATAIDLAGTEYPSEWEGVEELEPLQGKSLLPIFKGEKREPHEELYFHFAQNRALMTADGWKLVTHQSAKWELYDLNADPTELNDLADEHPEKVEAMSARWHELAIQDRLKEKARKPVNPNKEPPLLKKGGRPVK